MGLILTDDQFHKLWNWSTDIRELLEKLHPTEHSSPLLPNSGTIRGCGESGCPQCDPVVFETQAGFNMQEDKTVQKICIVKNENEEIFCATSLDKDSNPFADKNHLYKIVNISKPPGMIKKAVELHLFHWRRGWQDIDTDKELGIRLQILGNLLKPHVLETNQTYISSGEQINRGS